MYLHLLQEAMHRPTLAAQIKGRVGAASGCNMPAARVFAIHLYDVPVSHGAPALALHAVAVDGINRKMYNSSACHDLHSMAGCP
jgi:hypothetical protein